MIGTYESNLLAAKQEFDGLEAYLAQAATDGEPIHKVEEHLWWAVLRMGRQMLQGFVRRQGDGDVGETLTLDDGQTLKRLDSLHARRYVSVFGAMDIARKVYGTRESQKFQAVPLDARLELPDSDFSYLLQKWDQAFCVRDSFEGSAQSVATILGLEQSVRTLEHMNQRMASDVEGFRLSQPVPPADEEGPLMIVAADGKGVPMRREKNPPGLPPRKRRHKGEKANKKRMACVGAAYTIEPFKRTGEDVINEALHRAREAHRPVPQHKRVRADLTLEWEGEMTNGKDTLFAWLADEIQARTTESCVVVICLMDGERALLSTAVRYLPKNTVYILDLYHVIEKLWLAAHCFHAERSDEAAEFVEHRLRMLLRGQVSYVIAGLKQMATKHGLRGNKAKTIATVAGYFRANRDRMKYDEYLAAGYPIGSGAVEGACRHLVKDRMERTGMHWRVQGAQAMLNLRATYLNGDWDDFSAYRIEQETRRHYPYQPVIQRIEWKLAG